MGLVFRVCCWYQCLRGLNESQFLFKLNRKVVAMVEAGKGDESPQSDDFIVRELQGCRKRFSCPYRADLGSAG